MNPALPHRLLLLSALAAFSAGCGQERDSSLRGEDAWADSGSEPPPHRGPAEDGGRRPVADGGAGGDSDSDSDSDSDGDSDTQASVCGEGFQDNDGDNACLPTCATARLDCPDHSACSDETGVATCKCFTAYQGEQCDRCSDGYQDNDADGSCLRTCEAGGYDCGGHGACSDATGSAVCDCDPGYQDNDENRTCQPDCGTAALGCPDNGHCDDASGAAACFCDTGYQDNDADGSCLADCSTAPPDCGGNGRCDDLGGQVACACFPGHAGESCAACAEGYSDPGSGCVADYDWSFFVYLNADNDLADYGKADLSEMQLAGSLTGRVHLVVLYDQYLEGGNALYVVPNGSSIVRSWGEPDMGDWRTLRDFGVWAVSNYPARHYALVLWDHGAGWRTTTVTPRSKGFSIDVSGSGGDISIADGDYASALAEIAAATAGGRIDLVGFDACLMGMWEVAAASAPYADYLVASSADVPSLGWDYDDFLLTLRGDPGGTTPEALGAAIVESYYQDSSANSTMALTRLSAIGDLNAAITGLADALLAHPDRYSDFDALRAASQGFSSTDFRDLRDFAERVAGSPALPADVNAAALGVIERVSAAVAYNRAKSAYAHAYGLAIYFPGRDESVDYAYRGDGAVWSEATSWDDFLWSSGY